MTTLPSAAATSVSTSVQPGSVRVGLYAIGRHKSAHGTLARHIAVGPGDRDGDLSQVITVGLGELGLGERDPALINRPVGDAARNVKRRRKRLRYEAVGLGDLVPIAQANDFHLLRQDLG